MPNSKNSGFDFIFNPNHGLGDTLSCFNTNKKIWSPSNHFKILKKYSSCPAINQPSGVGLPVDKLHQVNFQGQHLFNRVRIVSGLDPLENPKAILDLINYKPIKNNIAFSFDVGSEVANQKIKLHPRARELYPEYRDIFEEFMSINSSKFNFFEIGLNSFNFNNSLNLTSLDLERTIDILSKCHFFIGMHSGLMHLATAIGLKCLIVVNFPRDDLFNFQNTNALENTQEMHWLYPQRGY